MGLLVVLRHEALLFVRVVLRHDYSYFDRVVPIFRSKLLPVQNISAMI